MLIRARQIAFQGAVDNVWGEGRNALVVQAKALEETGPEVLDQHIRFADEAPRHLLPSRCRHINRNAALVAAVVGEETRSWSLEEARAIALDRLDLDHIGAEVGEDEAAGRPHDH